MMHKTLQIELQRTDSNILSLLQLCSNNFNTNHTTSTKHKRTHTSTQHQTKKLKIIKNQHNLHKMIKHNSYSYTFVCMHCHQNPHFLLSIEKHDFTIHLHKHIINNKKNIEWPHTFSL